jgi:hypothetical protein
LAEFFARIRVFADLAQLVEQFIRNEKVASSIPAIGTSTQQLAVARNLKSPRSRSETRAFLLQAKCGCRSRADPIRVHGGSRLLLGARQEGDVALIAERSLSLLSGHFHHYP